MKVGELLSKLIDLPSDMEVVIETEWAPDLDPVYTSKAKNAIKAKVKNIKEIEGNQMIQGRPMKDITATLKLVIS